MQARDIVLAKNICQHSAHAGSCRKAFETTSVADTNQLNVKELSNPRDLLFVQIIAYCLLTPTSLALSRVCLVAMIVSFMCGIAAVCLLWHSTYPDYAYAESKPSVLLIA